MRPYEIVEGPDGRVHMCMGHPWCSSAFHVHGCYADDGNCNDPEAHRTTDV